MSCEGCNDCNSSCQYCEAYKQLYINDFKWRTRDKGADEPICEFFQKDDRFLTADEWNNFINYIQKKYEKDKNLKPEQVTVPKADDNNTHMTHDMFNKAVETMKSARDGNVAFKPGDKPYPVSKNDIIYAEYFNELKNYYNTEFYITYCAEKCESCNQCNDSVCNDCLGEDE